MPAQDSKVSELSKLKSKLIELENQLKEEKKITMKLREKSESKIQQIMLTDTLIAEEIERFKWKKESILNEHKFLNEKSNNKLNDILNKESDIKHKIADFDLMSYNNDLLHNTIKELSNEQLKNTIKYQKEVEKKSQKNFDIRIDMEDIQRMTIKSFNDNYQKDAITKMESEAYQAKFENDRIYREFDLRESKTNTLIKQQQQSYDQLMKVKIERDVLRVSVEYQEKLIKDLTLENNILSKELSDLNYNYINLQKEIKLLKENIEEKRELLQLLNKLKNELLPIQIESKHLCKDIIKLSQKIILSGLEISQNGREFQSSQISKSMESINIDDSKNNSPASSKDLDNKYNLNENEIVINNISENELHMNKFNNSKCNDINMINKQKHKRNKEIRNNMDYNNDIDINLSEINPNIIWNSNSIIPTNKQNYNNINISLTMNKNMDITYKPMNTHQKILLQKKMNDFSINNNQTQNSHIKTLNNTSFSMFSK